MTIDVMLLQTIIQALLSAIIAYTTDSCIGWA